MEQDSISLELTRVAGLVPQDALAFYGRWWQLENWLREVAYVELRAKYGTQWKSHLKGSAPQRATAEAVNRYMASADAEELLAYADVSDLFKLLEDQWELFEPILPPLPRWRGRTDELEDLRNRNAHCRRPHRDDHARLLQTLRDLEAGAWRFYISYLDTRRVLDGVSTDPVAEAWVQGEHDTARRLLGHGEDQYETTFQLWYSVRPWSTWPDKNQIAGSEGVLWHARWSMGGRDLDVRQLWRELSASVRKLLVHLLVDVGHITATFAAVDNPTKIADAIGAIFDDLLVTSRPFRGNSLDDWEGRWTEGVDELPRVVQANSPLTILDPYQTPCLIFDAET
jgi:Swt1-like HEPN